MDLEIKLKLILDRAAENDTKLKRAMEYSLLSPGKRIRPQLVYETAAHLGLSEHLSDPVALSIEMIHAFSLIHDDLPCMDDDDFRRGLPTNHKVFGEPVALLAGDALLTHAFGTFGVLVERVNASTYHQAFELLIQSVGAKGIMGGQALELDLRQPNLDQVIKVQHMKTTALFQAAILIPVLLAGYSKDHPIYKEHLKYSEAFGFAFQAADDLADESQDQARTQSAKNLLSFLPAAELRTRAKRQLLDCNLHSTSKLAHWLLQQLQ